jgi:P27 family predicted phage terminase small subunit
MANRKNSGKGGRKPRPTSLKIASGTRADRIPAGEAKAPPGAPACPEWLDDYGREGFALICESVAKLGLLSSADIGALSKYAVAYARWRRAGDQIKDAQTLEGAHGGLACHPAVGIQERAERTMLAIESSFGLSPSDRSRLRATEETIDEFEQWQRERGKV